MLSAYSVSNKKNASWISSGAACNYQGLPCPTPTLLSPLASELKVGEWRGCVSLCKDNSKRTTTCGGRQDLAAEMWIEKLCQDVEKRILPPQLVAPFTICLSSRQWGARPNHPAGLSSPHGWESWWLPLGIECQDCERR